MHLQLMLFIVQKKLIFLKVTTLAIVTCMEWYIAIKVGSYLMSWIPPSMDGFEVVLEFGMFVLVIAFSLETSTVIMVGNGK